MEAKWSRAFLLLVGVIVSFADPITDILTLVEFYHADHKTWFGVGLTFVVLPCFFFLILSFALSDYESRACRGYALTFLCGCHPFAAALRRLDVLLWYLKKLRAVDESDSASTADAEDEIFMYVFFESVLESAPQFIIQFYAVNVQEEPVTVIQIISLPVSFLTLAWAFTYVDAQFNRNGNARKVKYKLALFVTQVLLLGSRLSALCYFTVSYKWWVMVVLFCHIFVLAITDTVWSCQRVKCEIADVATSIFLYCVNWLRDDVSGMLRLWLGDLESGKELRRMQLFSNVLFVLENLVMILLYYFSQHSNNCYSLPITVCVCVLSVVAAVTRVKLYCILYDDRDNETVSNNSPTA